MSKLKQICNNGDRESHRIQGHSILVRSKMSLGVIAVACGPYHRTTLRHSSVQQRGMHTISLPHVYAQRVRSAICVLIARIKLDQVHENSLRHWLLAHNQDKHRESSSIDKLLSLPLSIYELVWVKFKLPRCKRSEEGYYYQCILSSQACDCQLMHRIDSRSSLDKMLWRFPMDYPTRRCYLSHNKSVINLLFSGQLESDGIFFIPPFLQEDFNVLTPRVGMPNLSSRFRL